MRRRNFWPLSVAGIILFGFIIVIALVYASLIQPSSPGHEYLQSQKEVERHLDSYMRDAEHFYNHYRIKLESAGQSLDLIPPFERKATINSTNSFSLKNSANNLKLSVSEIASPRGNVNIDHISVFAIHYYDKEYKSRVDYLASFGRLSEPIAYKKVQILKSSNFREESMLDLKSLAFVFEPLKIGRWKIIARISYTENSTARIAYLEGDASIR